jgi:hypothetical protein
VGVEARFRSEVGADRVLMDVGLMGCVVVGVDDAAAVVTGFPYVEFALQAEGKSSFDVLYCFFEGDFGVWR